MQNPTAQITLAPLPSKKKVRSCGDFSSAEEGYVESPAARLGRYRKLSPENPKFLWHACGRCGMIRAREGVDQRALAASPTNRSDGFMTDTIPAGGD